MAVYRNHLDDAIRGPIPVTEIIADDVHGLRNGRLLSKLNGIAETVCNGTCLRRESEGKRVETCLLNFEVAEICAYTKFSFCISTE